MDINKLYEKLAAELGHLNMEAEAIETRRALIKAKMAVLRELAAEMRRVPLLGGDHGAPASTTVNAQPDTPAS